MGRTLETQSHSSSAPTPHAARPLPGILRRKCGCAGAPGKAGSCEECGGEATQLQRRAAGAGRRGPGGGALAGVPAVVHEVLGSGGRPLDAHTRSLMEPRFGHDFSRVRVHTGGRAAESARAVNALAYTVGQQVVFGAGHYAPETVAGQKLLAHELAHVVQQRGGHSTSGAASEAHDEAEADRVERAVAEGGSAPSIQPGGFGLRRQPAPGGTAPGGTPAATGGATDVADQADRAEAACDIKTLCRLRFSSPTVVTPERVRAAFNDCRPGAKASLISLDPCLIPDSATLAGVPPGPPARPAQTGPLAPQAAGAGGPPASGGLNLPSTTLNLNLGPTKLKIDLPTTVSATLPVPFKGASLIDFNLNADIPKQFSFSVKINAVPYVNITARAGVNTENKTATAGLVFETKRTVCHATNEAAARAQLQKAGEALKGKIETALSPIPGDADKTLEAAKRLGEVGGAVAGVNSAIDAVKAACKQVPLATFEFGGRLPLEQQQLDPSRPPTQEQKDTAPYLGGTFTLRF